MQEIEKNLDTDLVVLDRLFGGKVKIGEAICSPLGGDDHPSFAFYISKSDRVRFKLFNTGENGSLVDFIALYEEINIGLALKRYDEILQGVETAEIEAIKDKHSSSSTPTHHPNLTVKNYFESFEYMYWLDYGITQKHLIFNDVYSVESLYYGDFCTDKSVPGTPTFAYLYDNGYKIYSPLAKDKRYKWKMHNVSNTICGYNCLPDKAPYLFIISSKKDAMCFRSWYSMKYNTPYEDIAVISPPAEGSIRPIIKAKEELIQRFRKVYIIPDTDKNGLILSEKLKSELEMPCKEVIFNFGYKDSIEEKCKDFGECIYYKNKPTIWQIR